MAGPAASGAARRWLAVIPVWYAVGVVLIVLGTVALQVLGMWMGGGREAVRSQLPQLGIFGVGIGVLGLATAILSFANVRLASLLTGSFSLVVLAWVAVRGILPARVVLPVAAVIAVVVVVALLR